MNDNNSFLIPSRSVFVRLEDGNIVTICVVHFSILYQVICNKAKVIYMFQNNIELFTTMHILKCTQI
jgi:hypothetical protein